MGVGSHDDAIPQAMQASARIVSLYGVRGGDMSVPVAVPMVGICYFRHSEKYGMQHGIWQWDIPFLT